MKTLIIAEAGVNHNGDLAIAKELIAKAAEAGADLVKFQSFITDKNITRHAPKADYQEKSTGKQETQYEMVKKLELSPEDHKVLLEECRKHGIGFFSTAFDDTSFDMLMEMGMEQIKIPSGEITNLPLLRHMTKWNKKVFLSTGMANLGDIEKALEIIEKAGTDRSNITVLHCTTEYPTPMEDVNLLAMVNIGKAFGVKIGYSDHTPGIEVPIAAVALGAQVIEKHFTLDRNLPGPDHKASIIPQELAAMVKSIRNIEKALGDGIKRPSPSELKNKPIARRSLVANRNISHGEAFSSENITVKRPGTGISPLLWDQVLGQLAKRAFVKDELIEIDSLQNSQ